MSQQQLFDRTFDSGSTSSASASGCHWSPLVGDRGMLTAAHIREDLAPTGCPESPALRAPVIEALHTAGSLQLSLFDQKDLGEIADPTFPSERLIVCRNPLLAEERSRKRDALLASTERNLERIRAHVEAGRSVGRNPAQPIRILPRGQPDGLDDAQQHLEGQGSEAAAKAIPIVSFAPCCRTGIPLRVGGHPGAMARRVRTEQGQSWGPTGASNGLPVVAARYGKKRRSRWACTSSPYQLPSASR